jgi:hypothetical protein
VSLSFSSPYRVRQGAPHRPSPSTPSLGPLPTRAFRLTVPVRVSRSVVRASRIPDPSLLCAPPPAGQGRLAPSHSQGPPTDLPRSIPGSGEGLRFDTGYLGREHRQGLTAPDGRGSHATARADRTRRPTSCPLLIEQVPIRQAECRMTQGIDDKSHTRRGQPVANFGISPPRSQSSRRVFGSHQSRRAFGPKPFEPFTRVFPRQRFEFGRFLCVLRVLYGRTPLFGSASNSAT